MADTISTRSNMGNHQDEQQEEEFEEEEEETISKRAKSSSRGRKMKSLNRGAWTPEEDTKLAQVIQIHGPRRWKSVAFKAGLNRCGKSCRLRWMNYLRPNIKRGNISDQEEDLILRLHKLLGNRWSLIAGRLPGRTDNEIKNYWNSYLSKKIKQGKNLQDNSDPTEKPDQKGQKRKRELNKCNENEVREKMEGICKSKNQEENLKESSSGEVEFNVDEFFDFSNENPSNLEWLSRFLHLDGKISCQFSRGN